MNRIVQISVFIITIILTACSSKTEQAVDNNAEKLRIVSLKSSSSEIICALGADYEIVGVDVTSTYPEPLNNISNLGHVSGITAQGILSLKPNLVIGDKNEVSESLVNQLQEVGVKVHLFSPEYSIEGTKRLIRQIAEWIDRKENAEQIIQDFDKEIEQLPTPTQAPKIVFVYARGAGTLMISGRGTQMHALIELAGAKNTFTEVDGFKPLTSESLVASNPDILFLFDSGFQSLGGKEGLSQIPGFDLTNAGRKGHVITMDGSLVSSFGPRLPEAMRQLMEKINQLSE